jgi:TRAP-type C4-dicarboxylate transport system permease small subunit
MEKRKFSAMEWFSITLLAGMVILIFGQVIFRYVFNNPPSWTEEIALLFFVFGTFACAVIAFKKDMHISIDAIFHISPPWLQKILNLVNSILILLFMITILITSLPILKASYYTPTAALRFPVALFYIPVTISCGFVIYFTLIKLFRKK